MTRRLKAALVGRERIELSTPGLKVRSSTTELAAQS